METGDPQEGTENRNIAPFPHELAELVEALAYKAGWSFTLDEDLDRGQGSAGLTLVIRVVGPDAYHPEQRRGVLHYFPVPPAAYNAESWERWTFDRVLDVERHEAMEFFRLLNGFRPYAPNHGPGHDPYVVRELTTDEARRTSFRGEVKPA